MTTQEQLFLAGRLIKSAAADHSTRNEAIGATLGGVGGAAGGGVGGFVGGMHVGDYLGSRFDPELQVPTRNINHAIEKVLLRAAHGGVGAVAGGAALGVGGLAAGAYGGAALAKHLSQPAPSKLQEFLARLQHKSAATAPSSLAGGVGGMGNSMPMASMVNQMNTSAMQNPMTAASLNPAQAGGGMLSRLAGSMHMSPASVLQNWKQMQLNNRGKALF